MRGGSLRTRLPLLIATLLAISVAAFAALGYYEVERSFITASRERVQSVARQLALLLGQTVQPRMDEVRRLAERSAVRTALATGDLVALETARSQILAFLQSSPQTIAVDLWDAAGRRVLGVPAPVAPGVAAVPAAVALTDRPAAAGITPVHDHGDDLLTYDIAGAVAAEEAPAVSPAGGGAPPIGYVVIRRRASSPGAAAAVGRLIGGELDVRFGSRRDGAWTDLSRAVARPPDSALNGEPAEYIDADGVARIGASSGVAGSPWLVWVSTERSDALAGVRGFLQRLMLVGLGTVLVGAAIGWWRAGRLTKPLVELTHAAEAIAAGDFSRRVPPGAATEVGRLGQAFNVMAEKVEDGYTRLDGRVQERTRELEAAMQSLHETQESLVRREKLAMLGQLASSVGHELRNPLGVMTNAVFYLELIQPDAPEEVRDYHGILKSQIGLAERIVSDLLDFSRIRPPQRQEVSLARLVEEQLARLGRLEGVTVRIEVPEDLPSAHIDPVQVGQVVLNLMLNAVQAMEDQGGVMTVRGRRDGESVALDVIDTGPGVPPELREKIFEALFTTRARGIGLGLAVSRSLAESNGGTLTVSNAADGGAMFTLVSPGVPAGVTT